MAQPASESTTFAPGMRLRFTWYYVALFLPFGIATPYLQTYLKWHVGLDPQMVGIVQGTLQVTAALAPFLWGMLSDRGGRRRTILLICTCGAMPAFLLFRFAGVSPGMALLAAAAFGMFFSPLIPLTDGLTFRYLHLRGGDYGVVRSGGSLAFVASALTMAALGVGRVEEATWIIPVAFSLMLAVQAGALFLLPGEREIRGEPVTVEPVASSPAVLAPGEVDLAGGASAATTPEPAAPAAEPAHSWQVFLGRPFVMFCLAAFLGRMAMTSYYHFFTNYIGVRFPGQSAGYLWAIGPLCEIPLIYFSQKLLVRFGEKNLFALGLIGIVVRLAATAMVGSFWLLIPVQFLHALTFGAYHAASITYVSRIVRAHMKSTGITLFAAFTGGIGGFCGGAVGGYVAEHFGYQSLYLSFSGLAAVGLVVLLLGVPRRPQPAAATP